jgi:hypothetical protein
VRVAVLGLAGIARKDDRVTAFDADPEIASLGSSTSARTVSSPATFATSVSVPKSALRGNPQVQPTNNFPSERSESKRPEAEAAQR